MNNYFDIIVIGEILWDCFEDRKVLAGAPYNFAKHAQTLGLQTFFISAVGHDSNGESILCQLRDNDLPFDCGYAGCATGSCSISTDPDGNNHFDIKTPAAWDYITPNLNYENQTLQTDAVYFGTLAQRHPHSRETIQNLVLAASGKKRLLDLNIRPPYVDDRIIRWSVEHCDILKYNVEEKSHLGQALFGQRTDNSQIIADECFNRYNVSVIVETLGDKGAKAWNRDGETAFAEAPKLRIRSTVGAGDAFFAAFYNALANGIPLSGALSTAVNYATHTLASP